MSFIAIEGLDGSGKSTQLNLLQQHLKERKIRYKYLHFPRTDSPVFGELVSMFLRGDLGSIDSVNPYLIALIYAGDRNDAKQMVEEWIKEGYLVIVDRYVYSNIAFQCAKLIEKNMQEKLAEWILNLEYNYYRIPKPELSIFLNVPFDFIKERLTEERKGDERSYLQGNQDIHEADLSFQEKVRQVYLHNIRKDANFRLIDCSREGKVLPPDKIFSKMVTILQENQIL
ncbi:MAG TPA: dTMP kinase [Bacteroidales bacterium]|nr:dTMP kinase [Bacteroidales bacterium]